MVGWLSDEVMSMGGVFSPEFRLEVTSGIFNILLSPDDLFEVSTPVTLSADDLRLVEGDELLLSVEAGEDALDESEDDALLPELLLSEAGEDAERGLRS